MLSTLLDLHCDLEDCIKRSVSSEEIESAIVTQSLQNGAADKKRVTLA